MFNKKLVLLIITIMLFACVSVILYAEIDARAREEMREIKERYQTFFRDFNSFTRYSPHQTRDLAISEMIYQFIYYDTEDWENSDKSDLSYDAHGRIQAIYHYWWDEEEEVWADHPITTFLNWDENNNLLQVIYHIIEDPYDMVFAVTTQTFNANNQITSLVMEFFDEDEEELVIWREMEFYYGTNGFAEWALMTDYEYMEYGRVTLSYDISNRISEILNEYSMDGEMWYLEGWSVIEYHPNDSSGYQDFQDFLNLLALEMGFDDPVWLSQPMYLSETFYYWDDEDWQPYERDIYTYYPDNKLESRICEEYWDEWSPENRVYYLYNVRDQLDIIYYQYYHYFEEEWTDYGRYLITMSEAADIDDDYLVPQPF